MLDQIKKDLPDFPDGNQRYMTAVRYFIENGSFPKPIILLEQHPGHFDIADGHHRYMAWIGALKLEEELKQIPNDVKEAFMKKLRDSWSIDNIARISENQEVWVAQSLRPSPA